MRVNSARSPSCMTIRLDTVLTYKLLKTKSFIDCIDTVFFFYYYAAKVQGKIWPSVKSSSILRDMHLLPSDSHSWSGKVFVHISHLPCSGTTYSPVLKQFCNYFLSNILIRYPYSFRFGYSYHHHFLFSPNKLTAWRPYEAKYTP